MKHTAVIIMLCVFPLIGCKSNMPAFERGDKSNPRKVLIAAEDSAFKRNVVEQLIETLGTDDWYFKVLGTDSLPETDIGQYGAVLLICKMTGGRVETRTRTFINEQPDNSKTILLLTTGGKGSIPDGARGDTGSVDAVSSPSKTDSPDEMVDELAALLRERF